MKIFITKASVWVKTRPVCNSLNGEPQTETFAHFQLSLSQITRNNQPRAHRAQWTACKLTPETRAGKQRADNSQPGETFHLQQVLVFRYYQLLCPDIAK